MIAAVFVLIGLLLQHGDCHANVENSTTVSAKAKLKKLQAEADDESNEEIGNIAENAEEAEKMLSNEHNQQLAFFIADQLGYVVKQAH